MSISRATVVNQNDQLFYGINSVLVSVKPRDQDVSDVHNEVEIQQYGFVKSICLLVK